MTQPRQLEDLVHRVNNLLGTIEIQAEVARSVGTPAAYDGALQLIVDSAQRTRAEMQRITNGAVSDGRVADDR